MDAKKVIVVIEKSKDYYDAYSENCDGIYAAGSGIAETKANVLEAIAALKRNLPEERWPELLKGDYEIEWKLDVPSFLEYYSQYMSLAGMQRVTGINQKQLSNYLNHRSVPRRKQADRIMEGMRKFASNLLSTTL